MHKRSLYPCAPRAAGFAFATLLVPVVGLALTALARPARAAEELFAIRQTDGRLQLVPRVFSAVQCGLRCWHCGQDGVEFEDYDSHGYFDGSVFVRSRGVAGAAGGETLELGGRRQNFHDWEVIDFSLTQAAHEVTAQYTVRTPINMPDVTFRVAEPNLTLLLIRHPELKSMLDEVLSASGEQGGFDFDPAVRAQVEPCRWEEPDGLADAVAVLLPKLASGDWREREQGERGLAALGRDGALYLLLRLDRHALSPQQNLGVDHVVSRFPLLSAGDRELCRRDPSRLGASQAGSLGRTE